MKQQNIFSLFTVLAGLVLLGAGCSSPVPTNPTNQANTVAPPYIQDTPTKMPISKTLPPTKKITPAAVVSRVNVTIANFSFQPSDISVAVGSTVTWTNNDSMAHTVSADDGSFDSGAIASGSTFSHTFLTAGNLFYHCSFHTSMHGGVNVVQ